MSPEWWKNICRYIIACWRRNMIYIVCFICSLGVVNIAKRVSGNKNVQYLMYFFAIFIPTLLGGLRHISIGTDTSYYIASDFATAKLYNNGLVNFLFDGPDREKLYLLLTYCVSKVTGGSWRVDINYLLFLFQFIIITGVFIGAYRYKKDVSMELVLLLFFLLYYNASYNAVRQYIAEAVIFAGYHNLCKGKYIKYIIYVTIASFFHLAALSSLILIPLHWFITHHAENRKKEIMRESILLCVILAGILSFKRIITFVISVGLIPSKYSYYIENVSVSSNNLETIMYIAEFLILIVFSDRLYKINKNADFYRVNLVLLIALLQLSRVLYYGNRFSMYFSLFNLIAIAEIPQLFKKGKSRQSITFIIILCAFVYWWYVYIYGNSGETYPYRFCF